MYPKEETSHHHLPQQRVQNHGQRHTLGLGGHSPQPSRIGTPHMVWATWSGDKPPPTPRPGPGQGEMHPSSSSSGPSVLQRSGLRGPWLTWMRKPG